MLSKIFRFLSLYALRSAKLLVVNLLFAIIIVSPFNQAISCLAQQSLPSANLSPAANNLKERLSAIENAVEFRRRELGIPGLSLAIVKDDKIIFIKGFGVRDLNKNLPVTPETLFAIGSTTKAFTAMTAAMSADEGRLSLDDSPKKFLPYFKLRDPESDAQVTLRDLLSHRTGLDRTDLSLAFSSSLTSEEIIKISGLAKPTARFREKWLYQNSMYTAAGAAVAKANGVSWEKLIEAKIFKPLWMTETNTSITEMQKSSDFSLGYDYNPETKETRNLKMVDLEKVAPAGAINSNAREMAQWLKFLLGGGSFEGKRLVSEKNFAELLAPQIQIAPKISYGLGWILREWQGKKAVDHAGNIDGFNAMVAMVPGERLGFVMLSNVSASPLGSELRQIIYLNLLGRASTNIEAKTSNLPLPAVKATNNTKASNGEISAAFKEIVGNYVTETNETPTDIIAGEDGKVLLVLKGQPPRRLIEKDKNNFVVEGLPETYMISIERNANGKMNGLVFKQGAFTVKLRSAALPPGAPSVEEVMKRVVEAAGGEANLRKHSSMIMQATKDLEYEGITSEITITAKAPNLFSSRTKYFALGRQIGETIDYFDGGSGGSVTTSNKIIAGTPFKMSGKVLEDARIAADFYATLNWRQLYQKIQIKRASKINGEDVYVVEKTPAAGHPVTDYVSQKTFLVLRRESSQPMGFGDAVAPFVEDFSDYKIVEGVALPFKIVSRSPDSRISTTIFKFVKFDVDIPVSTFRPN